jgi:hypothetical protein
VRLLTLIAAVLVLLPISVCQASIVIHDGQPGIVAFEGGGCLDSNGRVWSLTNGGAGGWVREGFEAYDVPVPVAKIKFWGWTYFISMSNEGWVLYSGHWVNFGPWPDAPVPAEKSTLGAVKGAFR